MHTEVFFMTNPLGQSPSPLPEILLRRFVVEVAVAPGDKPLIRLGQTEVAGPQALWNLLLANAAGSTLPAQPVPLRQGLDIAACLEEFARNGGTITSLPIHARKGVAAKPATMTLEDLGL